MQKKKSGSKDSPARFDKLREQAENLVLNRADASSDETLTFLELLHELKIHQVELEIQNEELKRSQHELSILHHEFENLYEFAPCGYLTLDSKGLITHVNLTAVNLLGTNRKFLTGSGFSQYIAADWNDAYHAVRQRAKVTGEKQSLELLLKTKADTPLWVRADIEADLNESGQLIQWRMVLLDISARRIAEDAKIVIEDQLRHAQKMESVGTLAGGIAHDFNNLLYIIMGNNELLMDELPEGSPFREQLGDIAEASIRAKNIVKQLLVFSHLGDAAQEPLDLGLVVSKSIQLIRSTIPANIKIVANIRKDIDPVLGNETRINQILINLCSNATDAISTQDGTITINLRNRILDEESARGNLLLKPGRYVELCVSDDGCGIEQHNVKRIFDPYFTTKDVNKGPGIGLAMVHGIVKDHHGSITVVSEPGKGSVFTIVLPAFTEKVLQEQVASHSMPGGNETILLVDDEPAVLDLGVQRLVRLGYTVRAFSDPLGALELFRTDPYAFDLVITDMAMPAMSGDKLLAKISKIRSQTPTILCTGYSEGFAEETAKDIGVSLFLLKPVDGFEFATCVRRVLDQSKKAD